MINLESFERVIKTLVALCERVRDARYFVQDGILVWATYDFARPAIAVQFDEGSFLRDENYAILSLEMGAKIPDGATAVDRRLQREMMEDACTVIVELIRSTDNNGDEIIHKVDPSSDKIAAWHDTEKKTQGLIAQVYIEY